MRVVLEDGTQLGVIPTNEALRKAEEMGLDLVEVSPNVRPPVCKIMDFGKFKYDQKKRANEAKKKQKTIEVKEVKFRPKTDKHDFDVKTDRIKRFIGDGNKVKVTVMFRGREIVHPEIGHNIMERVVADCEGLVEQESRPRMEGRQMFMILAPSRTQKPKPVEQAA